MEKWEHQIVKAVRWKDAHYNTNEDVKENIKHESVEYITTGVVIYSDDKGVTFASDVCETNTFRSRNMIPRAMIVEEWTIGPLVKKPVKKHQKKLLKASSDFAAPTVHADTLEH